MYRRSLVRWLQPRTLNDMLKRFKVAGAHPDILAGTHPSEATHNGQAMLRLEELLHLRTLPNTNPQRAQAAADLARTYRLHFWFRTKGAHEVGREVSVTAERQSPLRRVECELSPSSPDSVVYRQLKGLFSGAGVDDEFEMPPMHGASGGPPIDDMATALRDAGQRHAEHAAQSAGLMTRAEQGAANLRDFGIVLCFEDHLGVVSLLTMPDDSGAPAGCPALFSAQHELSAEVDRFLAERAMQPIDLRTAGSSTAIEGVASAIQRLSLLYLQNRGHCLRSGVCYILSAKAAVCSVAPDGCFRLPLQRPTEWADWLLGQPATVWVGCVEAHRDWRSFKAVRLQGHLRDLKRCADMFGVNRVLCQASAGSSNDWATGVVRMLLKDEAAIRTAVTKYNIKGEVLKKRGALGFRDGLKSTKDPEQEVAFRVQADGVVVFNAKNITSTQILRVLRDNVSRVQQALVRHDRCLASLEFLSRQLQARLLIETEWKKRLIVLDVDAPKDQDLLACLECFINTVKEAAPELAALLKVHAGRSRNFCLLVSDHYEATPSGLLCVPWDATFDGIRQLFIGR